MAPSAPARHRIRPTVCTCGVADPPSRPSRKFGGIANSGNIFQSVALGWRRSSCLCERSYGMTTKLSLLLSLMLCLRRRHTSTGEPLFPVSLAGNEHNEHTVPHVPLAAAIQNFTASLPCIGDPSRLNGRHGTWTQMLPPFFFPLRAKGPSPVWQYCCRALVVYHFLFSANFTVDTLLSLFSPNRNGKFRQRGSRAGLCSVGTKHHGQTNESNDAKVPSRNAIPRKAGR